MRSMSLASMPASAMAPRATATIMLSRSSDSRLPNGRWLQPTMQAVMAHSIPEFGRTLADGSAAGNRVGGGSDLLEIDALLDRQALEKAAQAIEAHLDRTQAQP